MIQLPQSAKVDMVVLERNRKDVSMYKKMFKIAYVIICISVITIATLIGIAINKARTNEDIEKIEETKEKIEIVEKEEKVEKELSTEIEKLQTTTPKKTEPQKTTQEKQSVEVKVEAPKEHIVPSTEPVVNDVVSTESNGTSLGQFKITAYCNCSKCCGKWAGGPTASGTMPTAGRTIAVDPKVIPLGTKVIINGHIYVAEDTGGAIKGNKIDMFFASHAEALAWGVKYKEVSLVN